MPIDPQGYTEDIGASAQRYVAIYPKEMGVLDPLIFKGRNFAIAATFTGTTKGTVDKAEYVYPVLE